MKQIPLTQGKFALVDDEDFEELSKHKWYANKIRWIFYAVRNIGTRPNRKAILMHRQIMNAKKGQEIDHRNGDGLYNRKSNLRFCTTKQNQHNQKSQIGSSRFKGVSWSKNNKKWLARIGFNYHQKYLGLFDNEIEAAKSYDQKAEEMFGEFANLNFPKKRGQNE